MTYFLPSDSTRNAEIAPGTQAGIAGALELSDLRVFWGPEFCRLEYLLHLLETGRVKDERLPEIA